jgi:hypothetical protein
MCASNLSIRHLYVNRYGANQHHLQRRHGSEEIQQLPQIRQRFHHFLFLLFLFLLIITLLSHVFIISALMLLLLVVVP